MTDIRLSIELETCFRETHGIGIAVKVFDEIETLWSKSMETITQCACEKGCPSCIQFGPKGRDARFSKRHCKIVFDGNLAAWMN